jgi:hypothetical protein
MPGAQRSRWRGGHELVTEVRNLLKPLSVLDEPDLVSKVEAEMAAA